MILQEIYDKSRTLVTSVMRGSIAISLGIIAWRINDKC